MDALILAGGEARRLHGADKPMVEVGDVTLLDRVIEACVTAVREPEDTSVEEAVFGTGQGAYAKRRPEQRPVTPEPKQRIVERLIVVGPPRTTRRDVQFVREDPPGGGPSAAIAAALSACSAPWVGVFAADLPFLTADAVHSLWTTATSASSGGGTACDGAVSLDAEGHEQWLAAVYRRDALLSKIAEHGQQGVRGIALRKLVSDLRLVRITQPGRAAFDCDTWEDVDAARRSIEVEADEGNRGRCSTPG